MITLGLCANLNMLNFYLIWLFILIAKKLYSHLRLSIWWILFRLIPLAIFISLALALKQHEQLYFGTDKGLFHSVKQLITNLFNNHSNYLMWYALSMALLCFIPILIRLRKKQFFSVTTLAFAFMFLHLVALFLQHILFGINYPLGRTLLIIYPIFIMFIFFGIQNIFSLSRKPGYVTAACTLPLVMGILFTFFNSLSIHSSFDYFLSQEQIPPKFYAALDSEQPEKQKKLSITSPLFISHQWDYYNLRKGVPYNFIENSDDQHSDMMIVSDLNFPSYQDKYDSLAVSKEHHMMILKRKSFLERDAFVSKSLSTPLITSDEFISLWEGNVDSTFPGIGHFEFNYALKIKPVDHQQRILITRVVYDRGGNILDYKQTRLDYLMTADKAFLDLRFSSSLWVMADKASRVGTYIWNFNKNKLLVEQADTDISLLKEPVL